MQFGDQFTLIPLVDESRKQQPQARLAYVASCDLRLARETAASFLRRILTSLFTLPRSLFTPRIDVSRGKPPIPYATWQENDSVLATTLRTAE